MSDQPKPTHTLILALALRVIADDLYSDGATVAAVALTDAAARLATLERKCMAMDQALRQIANSGKRGTRDRRNARAALSFVDSLMMNDAAPAPCVWRQDLDAGMWRGECGVAWELTFGTPASNGMNFCPKCGAVLKLQEAKP